MNLEQLVTGVQNVLEDQSFDPSKWVINPLQRDVGDTVIVNNERYSGMEFTINQIEEHKRVLESGDLDIFVDYIMKGPLEGEPTVRMRINPLDRPDEPDTGVWLLELHSRSWNGPNMEITFRAEDAIENGEFYLGDSTYRHPEPGNPPKYETDALILQDKNGSGAVQWNETGRRTATCYDFVEHTETGTSRLWINQVDGGTSPQGIWIGPQVSKKLIEVDS